MKGRRPAYPAFLGASGRIQDIRDLDARKLLAILEWVVERNPDRCEPGCRPAARCVPCVARDLRIVLEERGRLRVRRAWQERRLDQLARNATRRPPGGPRVA